MTLIHLLRHASHDHLGRILTGRQAGVSLSPEGRRQAEALARHMAAAGIDSLYASPRLRARETAAAIARETGIACRIADDLDEIDFGRWSGMAFEALARDPEWLRWNEERDTAATPGGETMQDVAARLTRFLEQLDQSFPGRAVALVSHADVIRAGICHYRNLPFRAVHDFEIAPASVTTLELGADGARLIACNLPPAPRDCPEFTARALA